MAHDGLYGSDDVTWRVNREMVLLAGGGRALLLQIAHPLVAAGVAQHSNYRQDPWGRLYRTLDITTRIVFGSGEESRAASRQLRAVHQRVQGVADDGTPYDARDPDLLMWVWATLVETSLLVYTRYVRPLPLVEVERYYVEQQRFGEATGIPADHFPPTYGDFTRYFATTVEDGLRVTDEAREVAQATLRPEAPLALRVAAWPAAELLNLVTVGLLPAVLRERFGFEWGPRREALLAASTAAVRRLLPLLPGMMREFPPARSAARR